MASVPITSWQIDGETMETETLLSWAAKITADGDCSHEIKRCLILEQHIKKQRHYLPINIHLVKAMDFPVVMYGYKSCTMKEAEHKRTDAFELCCWRRLLRVPWTARRSNQSILKEISPEYSFEGLMLELKLRYFCHLMPRTDSLEKTLMLGKMEGRRTRDDREWDGWMASLTRWPWVWASSGSWWWTGKPDVLQFMGPKESDTNEQLNTSELSDLTEHDYTIKWYTLKTGF